MFAVWYPLTGRAKADAFLAELLALKPPPTLVAELAIAGDTLALKMKGCGLVIINPPWQFERVAGPMLEYLAGVLRQAPGEASRLTWLVPEKSGSGGSI
jgi:23S rRNA (adenine2030-N6)-methyltransferase